MRLDQGRRRQAFGLARGVGRHRADHQAVAVFHQRMAHERQLCLSTRTLAVQPGVGVGGRGVCVVPTPLPVKAAFGGTTV